MGRQSSDMQPGVIHQTNGYGELEIIEYVTYRKARVRFVDTGYERFAQPGHIRRGGVKDLTRPSVHGFGFYGEGDFDSRNSPKAHAVWAGMIMRCYNEAQRHKFPTYAECSVWEGWRCFQDFAKWYEDNYPKDGGKYDLDKDIKIPGNKLYSPETCLFVSHAENTVAAKAKTYMLLTPKNKRRVLVYNLSEFCRKVGATQANMAKVVNGDRNHHMGWTLAPSIKTQS